MDSRSGEARGELGPTDIPGGEAEAAPHHLLREPARPCPRDAAAYTLPRGTTQSWA